MKKAIIFSILTTLFVSVMAQNVIVTIDGNHYTTGKNLITNPSFEENPAANKYMVNGWTLGNYEQMYTTDSGGAFLWFAQGGHDGGAYIQANKHTGSAGDGSIGQRWEIQPGKKYYISFWLAKNAAEDQYVPVLSLTNKESTAGGQNEERKLLGSSDADFGYGNCDNGEWCETVVTFDSEDYTYLQFSARWLKEGDTQVCFDDFYLSELTPVASNVYVFQMDTPGTLADSIPEAQKTNVSTLVLSGTINGDDITFIKSLPNLKNLDLEKATIRYETGSVRTEESELMQFDFTIPNSNKTLANDTYYLRNVESGLYLTADLYNHNGNQASLGTHGIDLIVTRLESGKYAIKSNIGEGYFGTANGYIYMDTEQTEWRINEVEDGIYTISLDGHFYIGYNGTNILVSQLTNSSSASAQWRFLTKDDLCTEMELTASEKNPVDATFLITGQGFNYRDSYRNNEWKGEPVLGGDVTNYCAEKWNTTFNIYQTIVDIPNGYYIATVQGFYRNGNGYAAAEEYNNGEEKIYAMFYANNVSNPLLSVFSESQKHEEGGWDYETVAGYIPNEMTTASEVFTTGAYADNKLVFLVEDGKLTIGIREDQTVNGSWAIFDNFELAYLGKEKPSIPLTPEEANKPELYIADGTYYLKNMESGLYLTAANAWGTQASLDTHGLDLTITRLENGKYTIETQIGIGYFGEINGYRFMDVEPTEWIFEEIEKDIYNITIDGTNYIGYDGTTILAPDLTDATSAATQWALITKEELLAEFASASKKNPVNATFLITGQGFTRTDDNRNNAWQDSPTTGGDNNNFCAEKYNTTFDVYQTLTDIPNGIYEVSVQGFYRNGGYTAAAAAHNAGTEELLAVFYANTETTPLMSIFAESKETAEDGWATPTTAGFVPNNMTDASNVFTSGAYADNKLQVIVTDNTLRIGIKQDSHTDADWTIFDNFTLIYLGKETPNINIPEQQGVIVNALQYFTLTIDGDKKLSKGSKASDTSVKLIDKADNSVAAFGATTIVDDNTVDIVLDKRVSKAGTYRLEFAAGEFSSMYDTRKTISSTNLLAGMQQLQQVSFFKNLSNIGTGIFHDCPNLLAVKWNSTLYANSLFFDAPSTTGNLIVYVPIGTACSYTGNVVRGIQASNIVLTDKKPLMIPTAFKAKSVSYTRSFSKPTTPGVAGGWETIVLPFDVTSIVSETRGALAPFNSGDSGVHPFWLAEQTGSGFSYTTSMKANHPYIISMPNSEEYAEEFNIRGNVTFSAADETGSVTVSATSTEDMAKGPNFELVPTYTTVAKSNTVYAINNEEYNNMEPGAVFVRNGRDIYPFEAYARNLSNVVSSPLYYSIGGNMGEANGIERLYRKTFDGLEAYSLDGVLYIRSPRIQTLGLYSADGRLVRLMNLQEGISTEYGLPAGIYFIGKQKVAVR
ncbi:MAG: hypothetical protein NC206_11360 [Bacteroides sp.]|nr:hypothetical protein [Roseburia sp.]MCM1347665.1 hypothetical protein [Bacteroides sp.]MCM1422118.1 hypothetical protein [Bacteroides sp.]